MPELDKNKVKLLLYEYLLLKYLKAYPLNHK